MLKFIKDKDEYVKILGGNVPNNFDNLNVQASSYINRQTFGRIDKDDIPEQVKYATCIIISLLDEENTKLSEIGNLKSQNIEGWSESYSTPEEIKTDYEEKMYSVLKTYLWDVIRKDGNPLLYCGVC